MKPKRLLTNLKTKLDIGSNIRFFVLAVLFCLASSGAKAQEQLVTLNLKNVSLKEALKEVEQQANVTFIYSDTEVDVKQMLSVDIQNEKLSLAMEKMLGGKSITWEIKGKQVVLSRTKSSSANLVNVKKLVTGIVLDSNDGAPLPGVNVYLKSAPSMGTSTDMDGRFKVTVEGEKPILVFSYVGYSNKEVDVTNVTELTVKIDPESKKLGEVVVVGYGTESKKLLSGSIGTISTDQMKERPVQGIDNVLQGQAAGVQISQNSGTPGGAMSVRIRGNSSITAGSQPLYVIDGIPVISENYGQVDFQGQGINALSDINPNDIESISILRDASSAAIYGARASNGVVLITTKRGKSQQTRFSFSSYYGVQEVAKTLDMLNATQWMEYRNNMAFNDGKSLPYTQSQIDNPTVNTDWLDQVFRRAPIENYEVSASSGNDKTTYFISAGYFKQGGILLGTDFRRFTGRLNLDHQVNKWFKLGSNFSVSNTFNNRVEGDQTLNGPLPNAISESPLISVYNADGTYNETGDFANPVAIGKESINKANTFRTLGNIFGEAKLAKGLTLQEKYGFDYYELNEHSYDPATTRQGAKYNGLGIEAFTKVLNITNNTTIDYNTTIANDHNIGVMIGNSFEIRNTVYSYLRGQDFPSPSLQYIGSAAVTEGSASATKSTLKSYFSRVKYNYKYKYIFTFNARFDGSSNFGENNRYGFFPSASVAWRVNQEEFLKDVAFISDLKLRISAGVTGNDRIGSFGYQGLYGGGFNYLGQSGIAPIQLPNPDLKWETTKESDFGFDFSVLKDRIGITFDYYKKNTSDLLLAQPVPLSSGFATINKNVGEVQNKGVDMSLNTVNVDGAFKWTSILNISTNKNKVTKLYGDAALQLFGRGNNALVQGQPLGVFYGYKWLGVDPSTGDCIFADLNKDGQITSADQEIIGNPYPKFVGGFTNTFTYKGWSLSLFLQYSYGNDIFNGNRIYIESLKGSDNQTTAVLNRWMQPGDITNIPRATNLDPNGNNRLSSRFIEDGSFLKVKTITLSYDFSSTMLKRVKLSGLKLYCTLQNLYTFTNYSGMDPDVNYAGDSNNLILGTDFFTYPQARMVTFGLNANF